MDDVSMEYDVLIVGAGPAGLAAGIKIKQLAAAQHIDISVCILEKGAYVGAHSLSGAVLEPHSLQELLPDQWQEAPLKTPVSQDYFYFLTKKHAITLPTPPQMKNEGNFIISLGELCQFLGKIAEELGCEIYPGFPAAHLLLKEHTLVGVQTGAVGIDKTGQKTINYQPGMRLYAKYTLLAEGCRGQLSQEVMKIFDLRKNVDPQTYGLGIKEKWQISPEWHKKGLVLHTLGWPLNSQTYGGGFMYHLDNDTAVVGFVVGLDYRNPWLDPFNEMQRFKTHPLIKKFLIGGERIGYGARAINEGGWQSLPKLTFPGGALVGDAAGFLNVTKIKGIHLAIGSGILAAKACFDALKTTSGEELTYTAYFKSSWMAKELYRERNIRPGFKYGLWIGLSNAFLETFLWKGHAPWTLKNHADYKQLRLAQYCKKINYPTPDGKLTFDKLSSVYLTNTFHEENQPAHLVLKNPELAIEVNYKQFASLETRYCPAAVYEILETTTGQKLQINAQNCIHCKTCDIKDPKQNILWKAPEGGGGPNYSAM